MRIKSKTVIMLILNLALLIFLAGCTSGFRERSVQRLPEGWQEKNLAHDGLTRWYRIYIPDPLPDNPTLVYYLHGGTLSMRSLFSPLADSTATWLNIAKEEGIILLVPNGVNPQTGDTYGDDQVWNDFRPDQAEGQSRVDDVGFLLSLLEHIGAEIPLDPERTFVTGASNGGMMTYRLLIEAPEYFAAGAAYIANLPDLDGTLPEPSKKTPLLIANGTEDPLMPYDGGPVAKDRGVVISTDETVAWWVQMNEADQDQKQVSFLPDLNPNDNCRIRKEIYPSGERGAEVRFYSVEGGGHTMPSLDQPGLFTRWASRLMGPVCRDADGVMLAWEFFNEMSTR